MCLKTIGSAQISGLRIGGNPFSGFSHQSSECNLERLDYHTAERIHQVLYTAEDYSTNTLLGRTADHIFKVLGDYRQEDEQIQWFAQICIERSDPNAWRKWLTGAIELGCTGAYIHSEVIDNRAYYRSLGPLSRSAGAHARR